MNKVKFAFIGALTMLAIVASVATNQAYASASTTAVAANVDGMQAMSYSSGAASYVTIKDIQWESHVKVSEVIIN